MFECASRIVVWLVRLPVDLDNLPEGFAVKDYLASTKAGTRMEVDILPRAKINALAVRAGCEIVTSHCLGGNDYLYSEEIVLHKPA